MDVNLQTNKRHSRSSDKNRMNALNFQEKQADSMITLLPWLHWIDAFIERSTQMIPSVYGAEAKHDAFRSSHVSPTGAKRLTDRESGSASFDSSLHEAQGFLPDNIPLIEAAFLKRNKSVCNKFNDAIYALIEARSVRLFVTVQA